MEGNISKPAMEGYLTKQGHKIPNMKKRYFVLSGKTLSYYKEKRHYDDHQHPIDAVEVTEVKDWSGSNAMGKRIPFGFTIETMKLKTFNCGAASEKEKKKWMMVLQDALDAPVLIKAEEEEERIKEDKKLSVRKESIEENVIKLKEEREKTAEMLKRKEQELEEARQRAQKTEEEAKIWERRYSEIAEEAQRTSDLLAEVAAAVRDKETAIEEEKERIEEQMRKRASRKRDEEGGEGEDDSEEEEAEVTETEFMRKERKKLKTLQQEMEELARKNEEKQKAANALREEFDRVRSSYQERVRSLSDVEMDLKRTRARSESLVKEVEDAKKQAEYMMQELIDAETRRLTAKSAVEPSCMGYLLLKESGEGPAAGVLTSLERVFCVLQHRVFSYYNTKEEYELGQPPVDVVHITGVEDWSGKSQMQILPNAFKFATMQRRVFRCSATLEEEKTEWMSAMAKATTTAPSSPRRKYSAEEVAQIKKRTLSRSGSVASTHELDPIDAEILFEGYLLRAEGSLILTMEKRYIVLCGDQLKIFPSREHHLGSKKFTSLHAANVGDWDGHGTTSPTSHGFKVDTHEQKPQYLAGLSEDDKQSWMKFIRQGITKRKIREESKRGGSLHSSPTYMELLDKLKLYFKVYDVQGTDPESTLYLWKGDYPGMLKSLDEKYKTNIAEDEEWKRLTNALEKIKQTLEASEKGAMIKKCDMEGYINMRGPKGLAMKLRYGVLQKTKFSSFSSWEDAAGTRPPLGEIEITNVLEWDGRQTFRVDYQHAFLIDSRHNGRFHCACETAEDKSNWTSAILAALGKVRGTTGEEDMEKTIARRKLKEKLSSYYETHNKEAMDNIDAHMGLQRSVKDYLLKLDETYDTSIANDPEWLALVEILDKQEEEEEVGIPRVEGYVEKQGHAVKLMKKRYAVVTGDQFRYYESQFAERSQPDDPIDLVLLVSIQSWSGTVGLKYYPHGFQLTTSKNKTFNCAVDTEREKEMWIRGVTESLAWAKSHHTRKKSILTQEEHERRERLKMEQATLLIQRRTRAWLAQKKMRAQGLSGTEMEEAQKNLNQDVNVMKMIAMMRGSAVSKTEKLKVRLEAIFRSRAEKLLTHVDALLFSYRGDPLKLLVDFDRIYGTSLATDSSLRSLMDLGTKEKERIHFLTETLGSGSADSSIPHMEGFLNKMNEKAQRNQRKYVLLHGSDLSVYDSREEYKQAKQGQTERMSILAVYDWDGLVNLPPGMDPLGIIAATVGRSEWGFQLECEDGGSRKIISLSAATEEEKKHWMHQARLSVATARVRKVEALATTPKKAPLATKLREFFDQICPQKSAFVPLLLMAYEGNEKELLLAVDKLYGRRFSSDEAWISCLPSPEDFPTTSEVHINEWETVEGWLAINDTTFALSNVTNVFANIMGSARFFCALSDLTLALYPSDTDRMKGEPASYEYKIDSFFPGRDLRANNFEIHTMEKKSFSCQTKESKSIGIWRKALSRACDRQLVKDLELLSAREFVQAPPLEPLKDASIEGYLRAASKFSNNEEKFFTLMGSELYCYDNRACALAGASPTQIWQIKHLVKRSKDMEAMPTAFRVAAENEELHFNTALPVEKEAWTRKIDEASDIAFGLNLLEESIREPSVPMDMKIENSTMEGFLTLRRNDLGFTKEMYCVLRRTALTWYASRADAVSGEQPVGRIEILGIADWDGTSLPGFRLDGMNLQDKNRWKTAIETEIRARKGESLMKRDVDLKTAEKKSDQTVRGSSLEGYLKRINEYVPGVITSQTEFYCVLLGHRVLLFKSEMSARNEEPPVEEVEITSVSKWEYKGNQLLGHTVNHGFSIQSLIHGTIVFNAGDAQHRAAWIQSIEDALNLKLALEVMDDSKKTNTKGKKRSSRTEECEGYLKMRSGTLDLAMREKFCRLSGTSLLYYASQEAYKAGEDPQGIAMVAGCKELKGDLPLGLNALKLGERNESFAFEVFTLQKTSIQCSAYTVEEKKRWMEALIECTYLYPEEKVIARNWALPKVAGAAIEGFLENVGSKIPTKVRIYCVLLGPSMLYYQSQEEAIANAVPLGVTEVHSVGEWDGSTGGLTSLVAVVGGLASQDNGFKIVDTEGELFCCIASSGVEKRLWMDQIRTQVELVDNEVKKITRKAARAERGEDVESDEDDEEEEEEEKEEDEEEEQSDRSSDASELDQLFKKAKSLQIGGEEEEEEEDSSVDGDDQDEEEKDEDASRRSSKLTSSETEASASDAEDDNPEDSPRRRSKTGNRAVPLPAKSPVPKKKGSSAPAPPVLGNTKTTRTPQKSKKKASTAPEESMFSWLYALCCCKAHKEPKRTGLREPLLSPKKKNYFVDSDEE